MPTSVEIFAGGGGMALGTRLSGFRHAQLVEWDAAACRVLRHNASEQPELWKPDTVRETDVRAWLSEVDSLNLTEIDLVAGGPPCQPFSTGGLAAGHEDPRNMFSSAIETVRKLAPKLVLFENVPGLLRESFKPYYEYLQNWLSRPEINPRPGELWTDHADRIARSRTSGLRYRVYPEVINAADLGVPQARKRVLLIGIRSDITGAETWKKISTSHSREELLRSQWVTGEYWEEHCVPTSDRPETPSPRDRRTVDLLRQGQLLPEGERWRTVRDAIKGLPTPVDGVPDDTFDSHVGIPGARVYKGHTGSAIDAPSKTIKAGVHGVCGGEAMIRWNDDSLRYLTVRESARVQSFPDSYQFSPLSRTSAMRVLGNAVAVDVAKEATSQLAAHIGLELDPIEI
ncbi:DNA (cytosine-5-)-methyltransferase [Saccharopolyspora hordei]|uniref:Cytosine-specific methyltransferase n=1 Tax=Saccharopolyspora hordei TaxID=1838 RepID=A0A853AEG6_9PSEU|nr:DNA (cytosine-5)-methyltransferase 1 [Saccharopolyspora hordei]